MSERIRRPHLKHPFEAKHVIVAGCAAIAMVLGAMSVGASFFPSNARPATRAEVSSIVTAQPEDEPSSEVNTTGLSRQHTLEVRDFLQQQSSPLYTTPQFKASGNSLTPVFNIGDLIHPIEQLQTQQSSAAGSGRDDSHKGSTSTSGDDATDAASTDTNLPPDNASTENSESTPSQESPSSSGMEMMSATPSPTE